MRIRIVGGGLGGLSAALAISRQAPGHDILVLERAESFGEVGAGIQLSPNAARVLERFGLAEGLEAVGFRPEAVDVRDAATGKPLFRTALGDQALARWGAPYWHVHRADLHALLAEAAAAAPGVRIRLGAEVEGLDPGDEERPAQLRLAGGEILEAELVIGADGWRSKVRQALFGDGQPRFTGQVAWRGLVPAEALAVRPPPVAGVWTGPGRHFVHYYVRGGELVNFVGVVEEGGAAPESWRERGDPAELARAFAGWPPVVEGLIRAAPEVWRWGLYERAPAPSWRRGRAALLGDAAHPMTPFLAQGAAMAMEDAWSLARLLREGDGPEAVFAAYQEARLPRTARVQQEARRNGLVFHLPGAARRALFGAAGLLDRSGGTSRLDWLFGYEA